MKALIAIMSCASLKHQEQAQRETWLQRSELPHLFYGGRGYEADRDDQIALDACDDYEHVFEKAKKLFEYALAHEYDFVLHSFLDTYVNVQRLVQADFRDCDYVGHRTGGGSVAHLVPIFFDELGRADYASGGAGTWLSARALRAILASTFLHWCDDLAIGTCLARENIHLWHDPRFQKHGEYLQPGSITTHLSKGTGIYHESWMLDCHRRSF